MQNEKVPAAMQDNVTQAVDWYGPLEAYHPDGRCFPVALDRSDHHVRYLSYHPFGETVYYDDGTAYDDDSEWRVRNCLASTTAQSEAVQKLVEAAEDNAWREARELVRGTNADLCKTGEQAYRIIQKGITDAANNRSLRTLKGRVAAHHESQP